MANNKKILGISRSHRFSPGSEERDAAIFNAVRRELEQRGYSVSVMSEDDFLFEVNGAAEGLFNYCVVFSMARDVRVLKVLAEAEAAGVPVVNSPKHLQSQTRMAQTTLFQAAGIPVPRTIFLSQGYEMPVGVRFPSWLKRSDACAQTAGDVRFVENRSALVEALDDFRRRAVPEAILCEHEEGDLIKFYGVAGTSFFHYTYPTRPGSFSKFGCEAINGAPHDYVFSSALLKQYADRAAQLCGIPVYGGDCVVRADGSFSFIDFNDWPSFSVCAAQAAVFIATLLETMKSKKQE